jgi:ATP-dependent DNA helicase RecG
MKISNLIRLKESEDKVEFKEAKTQFAYNSGKKSVLGYVTALANEGGGYLVLGIRESSPHEVCGSHAFEGREGKLEQDVYNDLKIRIQTESLKENGKRILIIKIPSRPIGKPLYFDDIPLMRVGESLTRMSEEMYISIIQELEPDFSAKICDGLTQTDLDEEAITRLKNMYAERQKNSSFRQIRTEQMLSDMKLSVGKKLTYAALILLGKAEKIDKYLPQSHIVWEFRHTEAQIHYDRRQTITQPDEYANFAENSTPAPEKETKQVKNASRILALIKQNSGITAYELMKELSLSESAVRKNMAKLVDHEMIKRIGSKKNGGWQIVEST